MSTSPAHCFAHLSPEPHLATRGLNRSARSSTAQFHRYGDINAIWADSELERCTGIVERMDTDTRELLPQPPKYKFWDASGRLREHTFDFLSIRKDGTHRYLFCKYYEEYVRKGYKALVAAMRANLDPDEPVSIEVRTEFSYSKAELDSAELLREAVRHHPDATYHRIVDHVSSTDHGVTVAELAHGFGGMKSVFWMTLRAAADGNVRFDLKKTFGADSIVTSALAIGEAR